MEGMEGTRGTTNTTLSTAPEAIQRVDGSLRLLAWGALLYIAVQRLSQGGTVSPLDYLLPLALFLGLSAALLLASVPSMAYSLQQSRQNQPLLMAALPLLLIVPYVIVARSNPEFDPSTILITGMLLFLPVSCAILNVPGLQRGDISLGLITVLVPLIAPLVQSRELTNLWLRVGAIALPLLLLLLSTRAQKQRLNFLLVCSVLSLWYGVQFGALPAYDLLPISLDGTEVVLYFDLAAAVLLLYTLGLSGWFNENGRIRLSFQPSLSGVLHILINLVLIFIFAGGVGIATGVLSLQTALSTVQASLADPRELLTQALLTYTLIALPRELLFRGALLPYFQEIFRGSTLKSALPIALSAVLFGVAYWQPDLDMGTPNSAIWFAVLVTVCGVFFARAYLSSRNIATSTTLHTMIHLIWRFAFKA